MFFKPIKFGQVYRATEDVAMLGIVILKAAGSSGFYCTIPKDTKIVIENDSWPWPISKGAYAIPLNYRELEVKIVPLEERVSPVYGMYTLVPLFKDLKQHFVKEDMHEIKFDDERAQEHWEWLRQIRNKKQRKDG